MRVLRRFLLALVLAVPMLAAAPSAAHAGGYCGTQVDHPPVTTPWIWYPCPAPQDQPVPAPVWITTEYGPGTGTYEWNFIKIEQGGRVFFTNALQDGGDRLYGAGFDSGIVPIGRTAEVAGVSSLAVGHYRMFEINGLYVGDLYVEPPAVCIECL